MSGGGLGLELDLPHYGCAVVNTTVINNTALSEYGRDAQGGGIWMFFTQADSAGTVQLLFLDNTILGNSAVTKGPWGAQGGGLYVFTSGGEVFVEPSTLTVSGCVFAHNVVQASEVSVYGGGMMCWLEAVVMSLDNSSFTGTMLRCVFCCRSDLSAYMSMHAVR